MLLWTSVFSHMFLKRAVSFTLALSLLLSSLYWNMALSLDSQGEIVPTYIHRYGRVKKNRYVPANIYICSFCLFILPPLFDKYSGCYGNGLIDVAEKIKILKWFWQHRSCVIWNSCTLVVMGLRLSFVIFCKQAAAKLKRFLWRRVYTFQEFSLFCSRSAAFTDRRTFDFCDLLCFVCNSWTVAKRMEIKLWPMRAPDQILDRFYVISMVFLSLTRRHLSCEVSIASRSEERCLYPQASSCYNTCYILSLKLSALHLCQSLPLCNIIIYN